MRQIQSDNFEFADKISRNIFQSQTEKVIELGRKNHHRDTGSKSGRHRERNKFDQRPHFEYAEKHGAGAELSRLVEKKFIAPQVADLINLKQIENFFESEFYQSLKTAKKTYREQRFNILLPASYFTQNEEFKDDIDKEEILVQGVIDLFFEDNHQNIILCDYKTDYLSPEELKSKELVIEKMKARHGTQLEYYSMAIDRFFGKKPDKVLIYSLPYGEAVEIDL